MSVVYWIRLDSHFDVNSCGYVGVAVDFDSRINKHHLVTSRGDSHFGRAIRFHGWKNLLKDVLFSGTDKECYLLEKKLRPDFQIGWNEAIGGQGGDRSAHIDYKSMAKPIGNRNSKRGEKNPFFGKTHGKASRDKLSATKAKSIIRTPDGVFFGFNSLARHLKTHKATAKKIALKNGWRIERNNEMP